MNAPYGMESLKALSPAVQKLSLKNLRGVAPRFDIALCRTIHISEAQEWFNAF